MSFRKKLFATSKSGLVKKLQKSLPKEYHVCNLTEMKIGDDGLKDLVQVIIDNKSFHTIELFGNGITDVGLEYVIEILGGNSGIHTVKLEFNNLSNYGAEKLANFLKINTAVKYLDLYNNKIGDSGAESFAKLLSVNNSIEYLGLFGADIHDKGAYELAKVLYLGQNQRLKSLVLQNNPIDDEDLVDAIQVCLKRNKGEKVDDSEFPILFVERVSRRENQRPVSVANLQPLNLGSRASQQHFSPVTDSPTTMGSGSGEDSPISRMMRNASHKSMPRTPTTTGGTDALNAQDQNRINQLEKENATLKRELESLKNDFNKLQLDIQKMSQIAQQLQQNSN